MELDIIKTTLIFGIVAVTMIAFFFLGAVYQDYQTCARWETQTYWQEARTTYMLTGKVMMPLHERAGWREKQVCVERNP